MIIITIMMILMIIMHIITLRVPGSHHGCPLQRELQQGPRKRESGTVSCRISLSLSISLSISYIYIYTLYIALHIYIYIYNRWEHV